MAYKRRVASNVVRLTGAPVGAGDTVAFRAPAAGRVIAIRALRSGGASSVVNGKVGSTNILSANLTAGNGTFASGATDLTKASGVGSGVLAAGDIVYATVVSGDATTVVVQIDYRVNQDVYDLP